jgi:hypothetical protein
MGRSQTVDNRVSPTGPLTSTFGRGEVRFFYKTTTFTIPAGVTAVRARVWGGGSNFHYNGTADTRSGPGGGFAMKVVTGLTPGGTVTITVPAGVATQDAAGGTCSFGSHVSATGGGTPSSTNLGGTGSGGDVNYTGGSTASNLSRPNTGGGGVANLFGDGGDGECNDQSGYYLSSKASGGGGGSYFSNNSQGGASLFAAGGQNAVGTAGYQMQVAQPGNMTGSLDLIGVGGGGGAGTGSSNQSQRGINGGGGGGGPGSNTPGGGGFPGGGAGSGNTTSSTTGAYGATGLVVVEF